MRQNHLEYLLDQIAGSCPTISHSLGLVWGQNICISSKFSDDADIAVQRPNCVNQYLTRIVPLECHFPNFLCPPKNDTEGKIKIGDHNDTLLGLLLIYHDSDIIAENIVPY